MFIKTSNISIKNLLWLFLFYLLTCTNLAYTEIDSDNIWRQYISLKTSEFNIGDSDSTIFLIKINKKLRADSLFKGVEILRILDTNHAIVKIQQKKASEFIDRGINLQQANNLWKLSPNLLKENDNVERIIVIKSSDKNKAIEFIRSNPDIKLITSYNKIIVIKAMISVIKKKLLPLPYITYIGSEAFSPKPESSIFDQDLSVNRVNLISNNFPHINGSGSIVSVKDFLPNISDIDLIGKYINSGVASDSVDLHGTDMATIIAGLGNSSLKGKGVAHKSKITSSDYNNIMPDPIHVFKNFEINVQNHSYGTEIENYYGALAESYDEQAFTYPSLLHIFSAGNSGELVPEDGVYKDLGEYANLTGNFKMAKNIITIGAIDYNEEILPFSSRGPAFDGRIKPELVAYSTIGTSNAAAIVSGIGLLIQQQYKLLYNTIPPSCLIKASLINAAKDIESPGPDYVTGYGNVNAYESILSILDNQFYIDKITAGEKKTYEISIPENTKDLKVTLVWTDKPAAANSNIALVNDLDLKVADSLGNIWYPWVLNHNAVPEKINLPATRNEDHLNNIEQVTISPITAGKYYIEINGFNISSPDQEFAVVYQTNMHNVFSWNYPTKNDLISYDVGIPVFLRWKSTYTENTGKLYINYDNSGSWQIVESNINLNNGIYAWLPDSAANSIAALKMVIDSNEYLSEEFVIATTTNLAITLKCDDNIELRWNENSNALYYNIYALQYDSMQIVDQTTNHSYIINETNAASSFFSVQPVFENNLAGERSFALNIENASQNCYIISFYADAMQQNNMVELFLELSSLYMVEYIELYRVNNDLQELIESIYQPVNMSFIIEDYNPLEFKNEYQAKVILNNEEEYWSEIIKVFFLSKVPFFVFPNPAVNKGINVYTKNFKNENVFFKLYNLQGKQLIKMELPFERNYVDLSFINSGVYIYHLESTDGFKESSILIIQ